MARNEELSAALEHARTARGTSIRDLAESAGVSTATVVRYLKAPDAVRPEVLNRITSALGLPNARLDGSGIWRIETEDPRVNAGMPQGSTQVVTDGRNVLTLEIPPGFLDGLDEDALDEIRQDALLEVLRLARAAKRRPSESG